MKKNYFSTFFNDQTHTKKGQLKSIFYITVLGLLLLPNFGNAQVTTHLSATVNNGGFESGTTGWTTAHSTTRNPWIINTGAPPPTTGGVNSAYISNSTTSGTPPIYQYTNTALVKVSHLYRSITVPAGETIIKLDFLWKGVGTAAEDGLRVYAIASPYTPTSAQPVNGFMLNGTGIGTAAPSYSQLGGTYIGQAAWAASPTLTIPASYAGTTFILDFEWSDAVAGTPTPNGSAAIDNVTLTSYNPMADNCVNAIPLTVTNSCTNATFTNVGSTDSVATNGAPAVTCGLGGGYIGSDVWLSATVGGDGSLLTTVSSSGAGSMSDPVMAIYSGTCGALTLIQCIDDVIGLYPQISLTGRTPGEVVYIRIWPYGTSSTATGTFNICATSPSCYVPTVNAATSITTTTATINWSPNVAGAPSGGYQYVYSTSNTTPTGAGTATAGTSANLIGLTQATTYYVFVRSFCGGTDYSGWSAAGSFTTIIPAPTTTGTTICQGGTVSISASALCSNFTNVGNNISGSLAVSDPTAFRLVNPTISTNACAFSTVSTNYTSQVFQVTATGTYTFGMQNNTVDFLAYITSGSFVPGNCSGGGTYIAGDDDSGATALEPAVTATLTAGTYYTLYTQAYTNGSSGSFTYNISGPGNILTTTAGVLQWWTASSGGTMIGTGTPFNPVGVAGSPLANTNTIGTTTFYAACSAFPNVRTGAAVTINSTPSSVISGSGSACASTTLSIALSGGGPWTFSYTDGTTTTGPITTSTTPYTFTPTPPGVPTNYTVSALSNAACGTTAAAYRTGTGTLYSKTWVGGSGANWSTAANWAPSGVPSATDCVVIANAGTPPVVNGSPYYAYGSKLTVNNGATLRVNGNNSLTITDGVTVNGTGNIILDDDASLVQITDVSSNNNTGNITFNRTATMQRADYVYWSSPFSALDANLIFPTTNPYYIWKWNPSLANPNGGQGYWVNGNDSPMTIGKGYIVRAPDTHPWTPTNYNVTLTGRPNNGIINTPVTRGSITASFPGNNGVTILATDDNWNLVGNPYPSSIDAVKFLTDNNSNLADLNVRLWTHNNPIGGTSSSFYNNYVWGYADSYTTFNISGPNPPGFGGKIASGQAFFVSVNEVSPTVQFNNTMRGFNYDNSQFFKASNNNVNYDNLQRSRIWVSILNEANANATTMICYVEGATLGKDRLFDAPSKDIGSLGLYSLVDDEKMTIQGRPAFNPSDIVPLAYTAEQNGIYKIAIANLDGLFEEESNDIYLEDTLLGVMHNLKDNYYTFTTNSGTFDTRFRLHYASTALGNSDVDGMNTFSYINNNVLNIKSTKNIENVDIFDITGKLIKSCKANSVSQNFETDFNYPNAVYVLKIKLENGVYVTKKQIK